VRLAGVVALAAGSASLALAIEASRLDRSALSCVVPERSEGHASSNVRVVFGLQ